jgi:hypothetical protein
MRKIDNIGARSKPPILKIGGKRIKANVFVFMKVGSHGDESFDEILERKSREQSSAKFMLWGYSGMLLNPIHLSRYLKTVWDDGYHPLLLMQETKSPFKNNPVRSTHFSINKIDWLPLPSNVWTCGCDKAIVCRNLSRVDFEINLADYRVAIGPSNGKSLSDYLRFRTDKACARHDAEQNGEATMAPIAWVAEILPPFAIYLSNSPTNQFRLLKMPADNDELGILKE